VTTCRDEQSLGTLESQPTDLGSFDLGDRVRRSVLEIELERLTQIGECVVLAISEARNVNIETLGHVVLAFVEDDGLNVNRLPRLRRPERPEGTLGRSSQT
jgi:hypothetical protein